MNIFGFGAGSTRWVILVGPLAFKVARIRPFYPLFRFFRLLCKNEVAEKIAKHRQDLGDELVSTMLEIFFTRGPQANLFEYRLYRSARDDDLYVPTYFTLFGLVNIQGRGMPVTEDEPLESNRAACFNRKHLCRYKGKLRVMDYGNKEDIPQAVIAPYATLAT